MVRTILLLTASNIFMTFAWYYHLKHQGWPLWKAIVLSWFIALFEYLLMVPANRLGYAGGLSGFQLKIIQEAITLVVFGIFAV
ncbi:MAG: DMT family protein, partial [Schleiferiaceae bacterium]